jgi:hypothetical protein
MNNFERETEKFMSFVKSIDSNKKVAILTHGTCSDGMASAVLMNEILSYFHYSMPEPIFMSLSYSKDMFGDSLTKKLTSE